MKVTQPEAIDVKNVYFLFDAFLAISSENIDRVAAYHTQCLQPIAAGFSCPSKTYSC
jgi:hypothetical protein